LPEIAPTIVLEFNAARYAEPRRFLDELLASYGTAQNSALMAPSCPWT